jgi:hypothetical protein
MRRSRQHLFREYRPSLDAPLREIRHHLHPGRFLDLPYAEAIVARIYVGRGQDFGVPDRWPSARSPLSDRHKRQQPRSGAANERPSDWNAAALYENDAAQNDCAGDAQ